MNSREELLDLASRCEYRAKYDTAVNPMSLLREAAQALRHHAQRPLPEMETAFLNLCEALGLQATPLAYLDAAAARAALTSTGVEAPAQRPLSSRLAERLADIIMMLDTPDAYNRPYIAAVCRSLLATVTSTERGGK